jgi:Skp family chaperone for outer membrane proteins
MMRQLQLSIPLTVICGVILAGSWFSRPARAAGDHPIAIGVVRTGDVIRGMAEMKKMQADGRAKLAELQQKEQQLEKELQALQQHRDNQVKPGSQQFIDESNQIDQKQVELQMWGQVSSMQLDRWKKQVMKDIYDHVAAATAQVAEHQQLDLVIADENPEIGPDMDKVTSQQLQAILASRAVLFCNKKADITADVAAQVEANFAKPGQAAGAPPIPAPAPGH